MKKSIVISLLAITILFGTAICSIASTGIVTTDTLRLRKEPSENSIILDLLEMNDTVSILGENNGWYKVKAKVDSNEYVGYASMQYIKIQEPTSEKTEAQGKENDTQENQETSEENTENEEKVLVKYVNNNVKVYITPLINSLVLNTTEKEQKVEITSEVNGWSYIKTEDVEGWVRTDNITEKEENVSDSEKNNTSSQKTGYISASSVNFRKEANNNATVITTLKLNDQVKILEKGTTWTQVQYAGNIGYIATKYISEKKITTSSRSSSSRTKTNTNVSNTQEIKKVAETEQLAKATVTKETTNANSVTGAEIVAFAKKYLGYKYVYGEESPSKGFDCSGFTTYVYKHFGYSISRSGTAQAKNGKAVSKSEMQEGDLICFSNSSSSKKIGHVGIYVGDGKFIHAANSRKGVIISNISGDGFYFVCARHII